MEVYFEESPVIEGVVGIETRNMLDGSGFESRLEQQIFSSPSPTKSVLSSRGKAVGACPWPPTAT
jgi:hypothetical protein